MVFFRIVKTGLLLCLLCPLHPHVHHVQPGYSPGNRTGTIRKSQFDTSIHPPWPGSNAIGQVNTGFSIRAGGCSPGGIEGIGVSLSWMMRESGPASGIDGCIAGMFGGSVISGITGGWTGVSGGIVGPGPGGICTVSGMPAGGCGDGDGAGVLTTEIPPAVIVLVLPTTCSPAASFVPPGLNAEM